MRFITQATKVLNEQKKSKRRLAVFMCLAAVVALGTVAALKMYGQAMSHKEKRLICTVEAHRHTDACYDADGNLVCGQADYLVHTHNDDCYGADGELVCYLPEIEAHTHTDACYTEEDVLVCTEQEQAHQHTDACYTPQRGELTCQMEEHTHGDDCYDSETGELTCQLEEHQHGDACYAWEEVLTCPYAAGGHQHNSDCYTRERGELTCQLEEHTHGDDCYDENGELTCQIEEHTHDDNCYAWGDVLTCQLEETPAGHTHTDACYEKKKVLTCGQLELHTHTEDCYDENGALACGLLELKGHTHQEECFETVELTDEEVAQKLEQEKMEESFQGENPGNAPEDGTGSTPDDGTESVSGDSVSSDEAGTVSVSGDETASISVNTEPPIIKTYEDEGYTVTASYYKDANIPEEAELRAELITAENNEEHYAEREAEIRKTLEDESLSMNALFKIGFYKEEQEIEPESDVTITVQFLDEKGLADGSPIAIVHFADGGSKVLSGGKAKDKSTTFKTNSFSEFAIIEGVEVEETDDVKTDDTDTEETEKPRQQKAEPDPGHIPISHTFEYKDDAYRITFHIKGDALIPESDKEKSAAKMISFGDEDKIIEVSQDEMSSANDDMEPEDGDTVSEGDDPNTEAGEETTVSAGDDTEMRAARKISEEDVAETEEADDEEGIEGDNDEIAEGEDAEEVDEDVEDSVADESEGEKTEQQGLAFDVKLMDKDSQEYAAIENYKETLDNKDAIFMTHALQYSLLYDGMELNIDECEIEADITPIDGLSEYVENDGDETKVQVIAAEVSEDTHVNQLATMFWDKDTKNKNMKVTLGNDGNNGIVMYGMNSANPQFTVQYYAYLDVLRRGTEGTKLNAKGEIINKLDTKGKIIPGSVEKLDTIGIEVIDTSNKGDGSGGNLPKNESGWSLPRQYLYVKGNQAVKGKTYEFVYDEMQLMEIFTENKRQFWEYPDLKYFNKFAKEGLNYDLYEIWVLKEGKKEDSIDRNDWKIYNEAFFKDQDFEFVNNEAAAPEGGKKILIKDNTVIRLVAKYNIGNYPVETAFFDYDITDGNIYKKDAEGNLIPATRAENVDGSTKLYAYTNQRGINSKDNYTTKGSKLAFGNFSDIGLQGVQYGQYYINKANPYMEKDNGGNWYYPSNAVYGKCSFGLVKNTLGSDGYPDFNVAAPKLFQLEDKTTEGKTIVPGYSLNFSRSGDTYTLSAVTGTKLNQLDKVQYTGKAYMHPSFPENDKRDMWVNLFWPMDDNSAGTHGTEGHDLKFGYADWGTDKLHLRNAMNDQNKEGGRFPNSDDGNIDHNSYFGMTFEVKFNLTEDYVGPLNYYFFGDDDMWVFMDDELICDIGGVHQAAGEYVNLWDWVDKKDIGEHTLKFFYTERGASGSTCWMQFTLPSVSAKPIVYPSGSFKNTLKVGKSVDGKPTDEEFEFTLKLRDKADHPLLNYYGYEIRDAKGNIVPIEGGNNGIKDGDKFKLKNGQSIIVRGLPDGAKYTIQESKYSNYIPVINSSIKADGIDEGTIDWERDDVVEYVNRETTYKLPETGGPGPILYTIAGVLCVMLGAGFMYRKSLKERRR